MWKFRKKPGNQRVRQRNVLDVRLSTAQVRRGQMRALGAINPNAVTEYEETRQRHTFLSTQADDLHQASKSLHAVVGELDAVMKKRFTETFKAVAEEFKRFFGMLFNGGTARLVLTDPDDPAMTGIDIVAQPPGKRMQSLALLSGGERALTATALLFARREIGGQNFAVGGKAQDRQEE